MHSCESRSVATTVAEHARSPRQCSVHAKDAKQEKWVEIWQAEYCKHRAIHLEPSSAANDSPPVRIERHTFSRYSHRSGRMKFNHQPTEMTGALRNRLPERKGMFQSFRHAEVLAKREITWVLGYEGEEAGEELAVRDLQETLEQHAHRQKILGAPNGERKAGRAIPKVVAPHRCRALVSPHTPACAQHIEAF